MKTRGNVEKKGLPKKEKRADFKGVSSLLIIVSELRVYYYKNSYEHNIFLTIHGTSLRSLLTARSRFIELSYRYYDFLDTDPEYHYHILQVLLYRFRLHSNTLFLPLKQNHPTDY